MLEWFLKTWVSRLDLQQYPSKGCCYLGKMSPFFFTWAYLTFLPGRGLADSSKGKQFFTLTWCRLRLACKAAFSFSSCFTLIFTTSWRNFSLASFVSRPLSRACLRCSSSASSPLPWESECVGTSYELLTATGACIPGELMSFAELDEVKDGEESDDKEEVTENKKHPKLIQKHPI